MCRKKSSPRLLLDETGWLCDTHFFLLKSRNYKHMVSLNIKDPEYVYGNVHWV